MKIRKFNQKDLNEIVDIFNHYALNDVCIFQIEPYSFEEIESKFQTILPVYPIYVAESSGKFVGFAYGSRWRD